MMSVQIVRNINISTCGMPMMSMGPMMSGCCPGMGMSVFCRPYPMMAMGGAVAAGMLTGAVLANPQILGAIGSGLKWGYNNLVLPVWNGVIKPVASWTYNSILKPAWNNFIKPTLGLIGQGLQWVWDHTLGWVIKKIGKKSGGETKAQGETTQASEIIKAEA